MSEEEGEIAQRTKSVLLIGSSGGGTATLGHTDPNELLTTVHRELLRIVEEDSLSISAETTVQEKKNCLGLSHAVFISLRDGGGFDSICDDDWKSRGDETSSPRGPQAALFTVGLQDDETFDNTTSVDQLQLQVKQLAKGPLSEINAQVKQIDDTLASFLSSKNSHICAIISLSSEPSLFHKTLSVASIKSIPVVGSGGTSLGILASDYDLEIIGNSGGSVASTTLTKARGWARGLAVEWGMRYDTDFNTNNNFTQLEINDVQMNAVPSLKSILEAALPSFLFVCIAYRFISLWFVEIVDEDKSCSNNSMMQQHPVKVLVFALRYIVLGTSLSVLAATSRNTSNSEDQSTLILSSTLAGVIASSSTSLSAECTSCGSGSALAGLLAGALVPPLSSSLSYFCIRHHITATMTNILLGGGVGTMVGLSIHLSGLAKSLGILTGVIRCILQGRRLTISAAAGESISWPILKMLAIIEYIQPHQAPRAGFGFLSGCIFVYGSKIGWYHSVFLPLILIEMDAASFSVLGAMDECALVMVCAGICTGNLIVPPLKDGGSGHRSLSWRALKTNISCGDFIEACYPYMDKSRLINVSAYIAAGLSCEILMQRRVLGSAYLPLPLTIWVSNDRTGMFLSCVVAFLICFVATVASNSIQRSR